MRHTPFHHINIMEQVGSRKPQNFARNSRAAAHVYIHVVELKLVHFVPSYVFPFFWFVCFRKYRSPCKIKMTKKNKTTRNNTSLCVKNWSNFCCATYLDQFLTYTWGQFATHENYHCSCFCWSPISIVSSAKMQVFERHTKRKQIHHLWTHRC